VIEVREDSVAYICSRYYLAPELLLNSTSYGCEMDMWSTGCILVELMALELIFPGDSSLEQLIDIVKILGTPTARQLQTCSPLNAEIQLSVLPGTDWGKILRRYAPSEEEMDLIRKIITYGDVAYSATGGAQTSLFQGHRQR
jgi:glycogen synthase kinase 3 beta